MHIQVWQSFSKIDLPLSHDMAGEVFCVRLKQSSPTCVWPTCAGLFLSACLIGSITRINSCIASFAIAERHVYFNPLNSVREFYLHFPRHSTNLTMLNKAEATQSGRLYLIIYWHSLAISGPFHLDFLPDAGHHVVLTNVRGRHEFTGRQARQARQADSPRYCAVPWWHDVTRWQDVTSDRSTESTDSMIVLIRLLPDVARCCQVLWVKHILQEALWIIGRCWKVLPLEWAFKKDIDGIDSLGLRYDGLAAIAAMTCRHSGFVASSILRRKANPLWWLFLGWKSQELWRVRHELHSKLQSLMSLRVTHSPTKSI